MADYTISPVAQLHETEAEGEDMGAPPTDDTVVLAAEADAGILKGPPADRGASSATVEDPGSLTTPALGDELTSPPLLS